MPAQQNAPEAVGHPDEKGKASHPIRHHMHWMRGAEAARLAKDTRLVPMRKVAKVVGRLVSMGFAIGPSRLMSRNLVRAMYSNEQVDWDAWVAVDPAAVAELVWITKLLLG